MSLGRGTAVLGVVLGCLTTGAVVGLTTAASSPRYSSPAPPRISSPAASASAVARPQTPPIAPRRVPAASRIQGSAEPTALVAAFHAGYYGAPAAGAPTVAGIAAAPDGKGYYVLRANGVV
ncbi:MAG: hypothetical protein ACYDAQ_10755, partial [Mycobacteriales bacterium]